MLLPDTLAHVADKVTSLWEKLNLFAARDMARRIADAESHMTPSADWQKYKMQQAGASVEEIRKKVQEINRLSEKQVKEIFEESVMKSFEEDSKIFTEAGVTPPPFNGEEARKMLQALYEQTNGELENYTRTTANQSQKILINALDDAMMRTLSGLQPKEQAIEQAIEKAAMAGLYVEYPSGHRDTVEVAVRRAVQTGVNQASLRMCIDECERIGTNFVIVSAHLGARTGETAHANHAGWQGKVYRLKDRSEGFWGLFEHLRDQLKGQNFPLLEEATGYPSDPLGLGGYNCRHNMAPYFPGVSENHMKQYDTEENRKAYENSQKQRAKERKLRELRRQIEALKAAKKEEDASEKLKEEIKKSLDVLQKKYKDRLEKYNDFCDENNLTPQLERTYIAKIRKPVEDEDKDDTVKVTETISGHENAPKTAKPGSVIDHTGKDGKTETRTFYDSQGVKKKDITNHDHGNPKQHPFGKHGEHAHEYVWGQRGELLARSTRDLNDQERKMNGDML